MEVSRRFGICCVLGQYSRAQPDQPSIRLTISARYDRECHGLFSFQKSRSDIDPGVPLEPERAAKLSVDIADFNPWRHYPDSAFIPATRCLSLSILNFGYALPKGIPVHFGTSITRPSSGLRLKDAVNCSGDAAGPTPPVLQSQPRARMKQTFKIKLT